MNRLTLTYGVRYDWINGGVPEQHIGPAELAPTRNFTFPADDYLNWKDLSPRAAAVFDVFDNGKTAIKASLNRYLQGQGSPVWAGFRRTRPPTSSTPPRASGTISIATTRWIATW